MSSNHEEECTRCFKSSEKEGMQMKFWLNNAALDPELDSGKHFNRSSSPANLECHPLPLNALFKVFFRSRALYRLRKKSRARFPPFPLVAVLHGRFPPFLLSRCSLASCRPRPASPDGIPLCCPPLGTGPGTEAEKKTKQARHHLGNFFRWCCSKSWKDLQVIAWLFSR